MALYFILTYNNNCILLYGINNLTAISPIDGRYRKQVEFFDEYFSEYALIKYRVLVEVEYFFLLGRQKFFELITNTWRQQFQKVADNFIVDDAQELKRLKKLLIMM